MLTISSSGIITNVPMLSPGCDLMKVQVWFTCLVLCPQCGGLKVKHVNSHFFSPFCLSDPGLPDFASISSTNLPVVGTPRQSIKQSWKCIFHNIIILPLNSAGKSLQLVVCTPFSLFNLYGSDIKLILKQVPQYRLYVYRIN